MSPEPWIKTAVHLDGALLLVRQMAPALAFPALGAHVILPSHMVTFKFLFVVELGLNPGPGHKGGFPFAFVFFETHSCYTIQANLRFTMKASVALNW